MSTQLATPTTGNPFAGSRLVAKAFEKAHKSVLQAIDNLPVAEQFRRQHFQPSTYTDGRGRQQRQVLMTRLGLTYLVLGFTGKQVAARKQGYLTQFDQAEADLQAAQGSVPAHLAPLDYEQQAQRATAAFLEQQVAQGRTLAQLSAAGLPETLLAAFTAMLRCGITPAELPQS
jgi:Rha family phage regulatory protein